MKIIDQTPFYKNGQLSMMDRAKAVMQFGTGWFKEIEAQNTVVSVLEKVLDKNYTLLKNVTPPGMDASIPFILIGTTGVYVMYVTPLVGMFRAKGDQWGTISGNTFKPEKPNLLTRTERMARAVQVYLQRQGYSELTSVEAVLLCSEPAFNVDSLRPIIRVVMRDALERFAVSVTQARVIFSPETVHEIVNRILNPPAPKSAEAPAPAAPVEAEPEVPDFALPGYEATPVPSPFQGEAPASASPFFQPETPATPAAPPRAPIRRRARLGRKEWTLLIVGFIIWVTIIIVFGTVIYLDLFR